MGLQLRESESGLQDHEMRHAIDDRAVESAEGEEHEKHDVVDGEARGCREEIHLSCLGDDYGCYEC